MDDKKAKFIADFLLNYTTYDNGKLPIIDILRVGIKNYIINNPNKLSINKYFKVLVSGIVNDLQSDLKYKIKINFDKTDKNTVAKTYTEYESHFLNIPKSPNFISSNYYLYNLYFVIYHEEFHMIVDELANNDSCFKLDILKYELMTASRIVENDNFLYNSLYEDISEEMNANLYGLKKAKEEILKINPNFKFIAPFEDLNKSYYTGGALAKTIKTTNYNEDDYIESLIDNKYPLYIKNNDVNEIRLIVRRMYNDDGNRKTFNELINDMQECLNKYPDNTDIYEFYYYLIYRVLKRYNFKDIDELIQDENNSIIIEDVLNMNKKLLETELEKLESTHMYNLFRKIQKNKTKNSIIDELNNITELSNNLSMKVRR